MNQCRFCQTPLDSKSKRHCSRDCAIRSKIKINPITACWEWQGPPSNMGYGQLGWKGYCAPAHRHSYLEYKGNIPPHRVVRHKCDNKICVNPEHLEIGTQRENMEDYAERQQPYRLNKRDIQDIIASNQSSSELGLRYGVDRSIIQRIRRGTAYSYWSGIRTMGRPNKPLTHEGKTQSVREWADELQCSDSLIYGRLKKKLPMDEVLSGKRKPYESTKRNLKPKN